MAGASGNILLSLSTSLGPGGFASLQSLIQMVGMAVTKVKEFAEANGAFARAIDQVTMDITAADKATKGLINTQDLYINAAKLEAAQLGATSKEFETLNRFGAVFAQKTGKDVTETVNALTTALVSGRTQGLKQFSLEIKQGATLAETYKTLMEELTIKAEGQEVVMRDLGDTIYALNNNLDTNIGLWTHMLMTMDGGDGILSKISETFAKANTTLTQHEEAIHDFIFSFENLEQGFTLLATGFGLGLADMTEHYNNFMLALRKDSIKKMAEEMVDYYKSESVFNETTNWTTTPLDTDYDVPAGSVFDEKMIGKEWATPGKTLEDLKGPKRGGGGGGGVTISRASGVSGLTADEEELFFGSGGAGVNPDLENYIMDGRANEQAADMNDIISKRVDIYEDELDAVEMLAANEEERLQLLRERMAEDPANMSLEEKGEVWQADYEQQQQQYQLELELHAWKLENDEAYEKQHNERMRALWMQKADFGMASAASLFGSLSKLQDKENKASFKRAQAYAIVEAVINTAAAAVKAMNAGLSIGGPAGIALGIAAMAAAVVAGAAQIATIKRQKYEAGGGGGGDVGAGSFSASASSAGSEAGGGGGDAKTEVIVTVNVEGSLAGVADGITAASEYAVKTGRWSQGNN